MEQAEASKVLYSLNDLIDLNASLHLFRNNCNCVIWQLIVLTALHLAIKLSKLEIIKMLLAANADMHIENENSETPLNMVIFSQNVELINMFAEKLRA